MKKLLRRIKMEKWKKLIEKRGLFDEKYYLFTYPDVRSKDIDPIMHYIKFGAKEGRNPNRNFDTKSYLTKYQDVKSCGVNPFYHYIKYGINEGRIATSVSESQNHVNSNIHFANIKHNPLVSIIVVNYNGEKDLSSFLDSILCQTYKNFELIIIDNNSKDNSIDIIKSYQDVINIKLIESEINHGFAQGNNLAIPHCNGEFFALINVDTRVHEDWLKELLEAMSTNHEAAAATSKTLFYERFVNIELQCTEKFSLDLKILENTLFYKKYFIRSGTQHNTHILSNNHKIVLSIPAQVGTYSFKLAKETNSQLQISIKIGKNKPNFYDFFDSLTIPLELSDANIINASNIINNAGSITKNNMPADRGIGQYDTGQYDQKENVDFFCGVSVLLRRSAILNRKIFVSEFFAYYEDSELSRWLRAQGFTISYVPRSLVYHKHSATSSAGSPLWKLLVSRSAALYTYDGNKVHLQNKINHLEKHFKKDIDQSFYDLLSSFSQQLSKRLQKSNSLVETTKPIGIYNSYWNTKGGGESHALSFATVLQKYDTVYLISETDFDIDELSQYYNLDLSNCRKIVEANIDTNITKKFYIFINSTYQSNLLSSAKKSFYIVSFPHKHIHPKMLNCYKFLYNSEYTKSWGIKYWGNNHKWDIIYPIGMLKNKTYTKKKEKVLLSVGRFFTGGHSKRQDIIAKVFKDLNISHPQIIKDWKLVLIGSLNESNIEDVKYLHKIKELLNNTNHQILINAKRTTLEDQYKKAYIYIHTSGFGIDINLHPENIEHFGITPIEAMQHGCCPIVYSVGGPKDTLKKINCGSVFSTVNDLKREILSEISDYVSSSTQISNDIQNKTTSFINENHPNQKILELWKI